VKPVRRKKPAIRHAEKANTTPKRFVREMRLDAGAEQQYRAGDSLTVSVFSEDKFVDVVATSKGKAPGSIASYASDAGHGPGPKRGKRMAGHMGNVRVTVKNHELVNIDEEKNLLIVKGSIPGAAGGYCIIRTAQKA
jgi:large subunit ribosomal protein L3